MKSSDSSDLVRLTVEEFVAKVASTDEPVPAGGSVAALTGACAAALLALACGLLVKREVAEASLLEERATTLKSELLSLIDEDAAAYNAFLDNKRDPAIIARVSDLPLRIARASRDVGALGEQVAARISGAVAADVRAARRLADGAANMALDLAEANLAMQREPGAKERLTGEIARLRS